MSDITDRVRGVLLGLAAGDRIGGPVRMALCLSESLLARRAFDEEHVFASYLSWWRNEGFDTGPVAEAVFRLVDSGVPREEAVCRVDEQLGGMTAGCNPAHRSPPLAMAAFIAPDQRRDLAGLDAGLTHHHHLAGSAAARTVGLCAELIRAGIWPEVIVPNDGGPPSNRGFAPEVLHTALHFLSRHETFADALTASIDFAGPSNYFPVLVGAIGGARWGASAIPPAMLAHCDILKRVRDVADAFAADWGE
jgi:ADP-ribosylglycohydrolase